MPIIEIENLEDPRLDAYARLTDVQLRSRLEPDKAILIAESSKVIKRALDSGLDPLSVLIGENRLHLERDLLSIFQNLYPEIEIFVAPEKELESLIGFELTRGTLAAFRRPPLPKIEDLLKEAKRVAVLDGITNHTNVGAAFRSAAALGVNAVLVSPDCYDPFYRRAARVSMGTVFQVPWTRIGKLDGPDGLAVLKRCGFFCAALALKDDSIELGDPMLNSQERLALILGTEGEGLDDSAIEAADACVMIPMHHGVDSLNVAAASAVAFWETRAKI